MASAAPHRDALSGGGDPNAPRSIRPFRDANRDEASASSHAATLRHRTVPPKLYRIGEIVDYSGVSRQTIHNYATMGLIRESRWTGGGHRLFDESVFERLDRIAEMRAANRSLQDIRDHFARLEAGEQASPRPAGPT
jgi:hypothetical protein